MSLGEPIVRIRELKKDHVNFVLENVDLAYATSCSYPFSISMGRAALRIPYDGL